MFFSFSLRFTVTTFPPHLRWLRPSFEGFLVIRRYRTTVVSSRTGHFLPILYRPSAEAGSSPRVSNAELQLKLSPIHTELRQISGFAATGPLTLILHALRCFTFIQFKFASLTFHQTPPRGDALGSSMGVPSVRVPRGLSPHVPRPCRALRVGEARQNAPRPPTEQCLRVRTLLFMLT